MLDKKLFINKFQTGSTENPNVGMGAIVGFDTYSKKGVTRLAKKMVIQTSNFTSYPTFFESSQSGTYIWAQCADGSVLYSADGGSNWQATATAFPVSGHGNGLIFFQNFMFAFTDTHIYYWKDTGVTSGSNPTAGSWVDWTTTKSLGLLQNFAIDPVTGLHFPFYYPNSRGVYFGNGNSGGITDAAINTSTLGFFGQVGQTLFNPGGTINTDFLWNGGILQLPSYTYTVGSINFLPPTSLAISVSQWQNPAQGAFLIQWDTTSNNKFSPPLQIFSNTFPNSNATVTAGLKQLTNRNQVLYVVTGGNHSIYETNGSTFNLIEDLALFSNVRTSAGAENDTPVFYNSFPSAITIVGNKLLTGTATLVNSSTYPATGTGVFPIGVWSMTFNPDGSHSTQCEFTLPIFGSTLTSPSGTGNYEQITAIKAISTVSSSTGQVAVGFHYKDTTNGESFGVAIVDLFNYVDNLNFTSLESELFEVGTPLNPKVVNNIEINLVKNLLTGQSIEISYRTGVDQPWSVLSNGSFIGDGTTNQYKITSNPIGATQFLQLRARMATGGSGNNPTNSPELRTIIIS